MGIPKPHHDGDDEPSRCFEIHKDAKREPQLPIYDRPYVHSSQRTTYNAG